ncbi:hypothetical protein [Truepera radiovictrix]|uniref:hypothetical protein n=1 Tax=Truepera radiovictrix TaxID=332249 RepID=UPI0011D14934|nr:hypothetical protein [Truepera radiovictrix]WMT56524.1 hypothetical protein RCV51_10980 [Truepera radiovictrix]
MIRVLAILIAALCVTPHLAVAEQEYENTCDGAYEYVLDWFESQEDTFATDATPEPTLGDVMRWNVEYLQAHEPPNLFEPYVGAAIEFFTFIAVDTATPPPDDVTLWTVVEKLENEAEKLVVECGNNHPLVTEYVNAVLATPTAE